MQEINIRPLGYLIVSMTLTPINEEQRELGRVIFFVKDFFIKNSLFIFD